VTWPAKTERTSFFAPLESGWQKKTREMIDESYFSIHFFAARAISSQTGFVFLPDKMRYVSPYALDYKICNRHFLLHPLLKHANRGKKYVASHFARFPIHG